MTDFFTSCFSDLITAPADLTIQNHGNRILRIYCERESSHADLLIRQLITQRINDFWILGLILSRPTKCRRLFSAPSGFYLQGLAHKRGIFCTVLQPRPLLRLFVLMDRPYIFVAFVYWWRQNRVYLTRCAGWRVVRVSLDLLTTIITMSGLSSTRILIWYVLVGTV